MIDILLLILAIILIVIGILGCVLPIIPGPPISFIALLVVHFTKFADFSVNFLIIMGGLALLVTILDYIVPVWGTKKFGGSKAGVWGSTIGLLIGVIFAPFGLISIIVGPFLGAFIGEMISGKDSQKSLRAAFGSFIGFLMGVGMKLIASLIITVYFIKEII